MGYEAVVSPNEVRTARYRSGRCPRRGISTATTSGRTACCTAARPHAHAHADCPLDFFRTWIDDPVKTQEQVQQIVDQAGEPSAR
ncbi:hypothetical protein ACFQZZ_09405 [Nocardia sp. GCM10030253]|uniref:hypothetical protein n=1 Tax=Nocardia sp. GCM10030253 TaxID=3273404 RepID=UPI00363408D9